MSDTNSKEILDLSGISFSSLGAVEKRTDEQVLANIIPILRQILHKRFANESPKQEIDHRDKGISTEQRLNFACPYCGDSFKNPWKKRGNIYVPGFGFHCYNCRTHTNLETFLSDFGYKLDSADKIHVFNSNKELKDSVKQTSTLDFSILTDFDMLDNFALSKVQLYKHFKLLDITHKDSWWIRKYLTERHQTDFNKFAWDKKRNRLIIFNYLPSGKILGFQARNFKSDVKYVTYTLLMIYKLLEIEPSQSEAFIEANRLSFLFGLDKMDMTKVVTVFEGPLDSFLIENGVSVCGIENDFPLDIPRRFLLDRDADGIRKSLEYLNKGETVFLWSKFIKDEKIKIKRNKIDLNDVVNYLKDEKRDLPNLNKYFSNSKYDMLDV